ncbi:RTA1-like protein [Agrocybe pediades]|nr:RTA1-like protein [Agrocybe pediades]
MRRFFHCLSFLLFYICPIALGKQARPPTADPFADPAHDPNNPLRYIASNTLTGIAFGLVMIVAISQTWLIMTRGAKWMASMPIGCYCFAAGLGSRFGLHSSPDSKGLYIFEYLFVVLSPCLFIAAIYVVLARLSKHLNADKHLLISPRRITFLFVASDVTTFLIQATGGALTTSDSPSTAVTGSHLFLVGLSIQLVSFACFTGIYLLFLHRVWTHERRIWFMDDRKPWYNNWHALAGALCLSCIGVLIRSGYRVAEIAEGFEGALTRSEPLFYGLDTYPLLVAISVYIPFWPGRFINAKNWDKVPSNELEDLNGKADQRPPA